MPKIFLTHTPTARAQYYGDRALAGLRKQVNTLVMLDGRARWYDGHTAVDDESSCKIK